MDNIIGAKTLIDQLIAQGVDTFCLSPGSRSTPLVIALAENPNAKTHVHFDERGLGFFALGIAKATKKTVALIVTSGTAVGNLMPAVMESCEGHVPLIILTADRPPLLRQTMANQTTDQIKIFGTFVRSFTDLPTPQPHHERFLATTVAHAVSTSQYPLPGPVHLNCPFVEPFFGRNEAPTHSVPSPQITHPQYSFDMPPWISSIEKGVIVVGANGGDPTLDQLAQKLKWPVLADINSNYRHLAKATTIPYYHHLLKHNSDLQAEAVFIFGDAVVSKELLNWIKKQPRVIHIAPHHKRCDPHHCVTDRVMTSPSAFARALLTHLPDKSSDWLTTWQELSQLPLDEPTLTEWGIPHYLSRILPSNTALFIGNSMPIRDADAFFFPKNPTGPIFANRGLSGIDGNIATCAGIAQNTPLWAVIGDQTFLHDLNSLPLLNKAPHPIKLIVINNGGGGIFSFLPIAEKTELLDPFFAAAHTFEFAHAASLFDLPYFTPKSIGDLGTALHTSETCFIEVKTNRNENVALHKLIDQKIEQGTIPKQLLQ